MGFKNHELFIKKHQDRFHGPFLEIGAKDYGSTVNLRAMFRARPMSASTWRKARALIGCST